MGRRAGFLFIAGGAALTAIALSTLLTGGSANPGRPPPTDRRDTTAQAPPTALRRCGRPPRPDLPTGTPRSLPTSTALAGRADDFVESIGVNVHLAYTSTPYARYDLVEQKLRELGVRYIRDGIAQNKPEVYEALRGLASCGIRLDLLVGDPLERFGGGSLAEQLGLAKKELKRVVVSLEGPNEFDGQ